jgi:hypothetical protein
MDYVRFIYRPLAARAARQVLVGRNRVRQSPDRGRFTRANVGALLKTAWIDYAERAGKLPSEQTVGSRMNVRLACFTMSFFNALLASGTEREYAIELVADAAWKVYRLWSIIALGLAHLTPGKTTALAFAVSTHGNPQGDVSLRFRSMLPGTSSNPFPPIVERPSMSSDAQSRTISAARGPSISVPRPGAISTMHLPSWLTRSLFAPRRLSVAMTGVTFD